MPSLWNRVSLAAASFEVFEPCAALALFGFGVLSVLSTFFNGSLQPDFREPLLRDWAE